MGAVKNIEPWQIKKMFAISKNLGMDKDDIHAMANVESIKELDIMQANEVLSRLEKMQGKYVPQKKPDKNVKSKHKQVAGMITEGQQRKVWQLMYELKALDKEPNTATLGDRLCGIIKKELDTNATAGNPFIWVNFKSGNKLIEILKKYVASAHKKSGDSG